MVQDGQTVDSNARRRLAAFISYAHADAAIAGKLQSRLERYRLPKHIAAAHAQGQAALGQIFRDREDLAAAPSLSDAIRAAIAEAEALIVICSPDAQASRWVGEEIALFRRLHPDRPILAALVRGEPDDAFPAALTQDGNEPLAADLRKEGDGEALGFLKIVAGIAGVPLDTLVQRDAQRRIRRVMWITGGALTAMLVMGVMTTLALQARNEAARQRAEAEGLVEYMLTDLRLKLEGVGRLHVMEGVNARAMRYYKEQGDLARLSPNSLLQRARIIEAMGRDDENRGDAIAAKQKYSQLARVTENLLVREPKNPIRIHAHAQSLNRLALLAFTQNQLDEALKGFDSSRKLIVPLLTKKLPKPEWLRVGAYASGNICAALLQKKAAPDVALRRCNEAVSYNERLIELEPQSAEPIYDLVFQLSWLDAAFEANKDAKNALASSQRALTLIEQLRQLDSENMLWREQEMQVRVRLANKFAALGDQKRHDYELAIARGINRALLSAEPANAVWQKYASRLSKN